MKVLIRQEAPSDFKEVFDVIENAFRSEKFSDKREQFLVERLRKSSAFIPELSLVADFENKVIGHILLTNLKIVNDEAQFDSLALAPVSVLPKYQGKGIGGKLILHAHNIAQSLGYKSIVLLGHENYYRKFGYELAEGYSIEFPFEAPAENCMVKELIENELKGVSGTVVYPKEFYD